MSPKQQNQSQCYVYDDENKQDDSRDYAYSAQSAFVYHFLGGSIFSPPSLAKYSCRILSTRGSCSLSSFFTNSTSASCQHLLGSGCSRQDAGLSSALLTCVGAKHRTRTVTSASVNLRIMASPHAGRIAVPLALAKM